MLNTSRLKKNEISTLQTVTEIFTRRLLDLNVELRQALDVEAYELAAIQKLLIDDLIAEIVEIFHNITHLETAFLRTHFYNQDTQIREELIKINNTYYETEYFPSDEDED